MYVKYNRPMNRPRALRRNASVIGGTGRRKERRECATRNLREPGLREVAVEATRDQVNASCVFILKVMTVHECDGRNITAEVESTSRRLRETIRVRELAAMHRLGQMRRLLMLEEQKIW